MSATTPTPITDALRALSEALQAADRPPGEYIRGPKLQVHRPVFDRLHAELKIFSRHTTSGLQRPEDIWNTREHGPTSITVAWIEVIPCD